MYCLKVLFKVYIDLVLKYSVSFKIFVMFAMNKGEGFYFVLLSVVIVWLVIWVWFFYS